MFQLSARAWPRNQCWCGLSEDTSEHDHRRRVDSVLLGGGVHGEVTAVRGDVAGVLADVNGRTGPGWRRRCRPWSRPAAGPAVEYGAASGGVPTQKGPEEPSPCTRRLRPWQAGPAYCRGTRWRRPSRRRSSCAAASANRCPRSARTPCAAGQPSCPAPTGFPPLRCPGRRRHRPAAAGDPRRRPGRDVLPRPRPPRPRPARGVHRHRGTGD